MSHRLCRAVEDLGQWLFVVLLAAMILPLAQAASAEMQRATLRLDGAPVGYHAPFFLALSRGYYKDIDLRIFDGNGSLSTLTAISGGADTIGIASLATMSLAFSQGRSLIAVAGIIQKMPSGVIAIRGSGITKPKDLEGKTWGYSADDYSTKLFPTFASAACIDESKIRKVRLSRAVVHSALLQGTIDFMIGEEFIDELRIARQKEIEKPIRYPESAMILGSGIFVNKATVAGKSNLLRDFLAATARGFDDAMLDPEAAVDAVMAARPMADRALLREQLRRMKPYLSTENSKGKGFGYMEVADWEKTLKFLKQAFDFQVEVKASDLYTNDLLPATSK